MRRYLRAVVDAEKLCRSSPEPDASSPRRESPEFSCAVGMRRFQIFPPFFITNGMRPLRWHAFVIAERNVHRSKRRERNVGVDLLELNPLARVFALLLGEDPTCWLR